MTAPAPDAADQYIAEEGRLNVSGRDQVGIVAAVSAVLTRAGAARIGRPRNEA